MALSTRKASHQRQGSDQGDDVAVRIRPQLLAGFRVFLGRKPSPDRLPNFTTHYDLNRTLQKSEEFRTSERSKKTRLGWPLSQVFVSQNARVLYCPIGKNACTFLKSEITRTQGLLHTPYILRDIHFVTDHVRTGLQLSDYSKEDAAALMTNDDYFKFAVLRDPADRLLSAYIEKFVVGRLSAANMHHTKSVVVPVQSMQGLTETDFDRGITFRQFIDFIAKADPEHLDPHWRPQTLYLAGIEYDRLFRIDELDDLITILEERTGMTLNRKARNVTGSGKGTFLRGAADLLPAQIAAAPRISKNSFWDPDVREAMEQVYASDYTLFENTKGH